MPRPLAIPRLAAEGVAFEAGARRLALARVEQALHDQVGPWQAALRTATGTTTPRSRRAKRTTRR